MADKIFSVSELNQYIRSIMDEDPLLASVYVRGELSNYKVYPSGHHYFTMKDQEGSLRCVMFRGNASRLRFKPESGMKVIAFGRVSVYPRDGAYQLYVTELTPDGVGELYVAFEQLKAKLAEKGYFAAEHKKKLPRFPARIAVVTSPAGAAVRDIIRILKKRWPLAKVIVLPVRVQGSEAPPEIASAIAYANRHALAEVIITGRGGGSMEDLWAFNDERVAKAIYDSVIPVISAVGHEPDYTISDFVADLRAATPSNAAELCVPDVGEIRESLRSYEVRSAQHMRHMLDTCRRRLDNYSQRRFMTDPGAYVNDKRLLLDNVQSKLLTSFERGVKVRRERFVHAAAAMDAMSPMKVLGRGYAIAEKTDGQVIRSAKEVKNGESFTVRFAKSTLKCTAEKGRRNNGRE